MLSPDSRSSAESALDTERILLVLRRSLSTDTWLVCSGDVARGSDVCDDRPSASSCHGGSVRVGLAPPNPDRFANGLDGEARGDRAPLPARRDRLDGDRRVVAAFVLAAPAVAGVVVVVDVNVALAPAPAPPASSSCSHQKSCFRTASAAWCRRASGGVGACSLHATTRSPCMRQHTNSRPPAGSYTSTGHTDVPKRLDVRRNCSASHDWRVWRLAKWRRRCDRTGVVYPHSRHACSTRRHGHSRIAPGRYGRFVVQRCRRRW